MNFKQYENNYKTITSYLLNGKASYKTVYIDEYMMVHAGFIGLVAMKTKCSKIVLMGDNRQIPYIDRLQYVNMRFHDASKIIADFQQLNTTLRCPADIVVALKHVYPDFCSASNIKRSVKYTKLTSGVTGIPIISNALYLTFTRADKKVLKSNLTLPTSSKVCTIHEAQGLTIKNVICVRLSAKPIKLYESLQHIVVALTRHTDSFNYFSPVEDDLLFILIKKARYASENHLIQASTSLPNSDDRTLDMTSTKQNSGPHTHFTVYFQNVNKMASKASIFYNYVLKTQFLIYAICETSFNSDIHSSEFFPSEYVVYRCDRSVSSSSKKTGGGVLLAVHSSVTSELVEISAKNIEHVSIKLTINSKNVFIYVPYIPPDSNSEIYMACSESISEIYNSSNLADLILIMGDFNLTNIKWTYDSEMSALLPYNVNSEMECLFIDAVLHLNLNQINHIANERGRFLDLILANELNVVNVIESLQPFVQNDINHKAYEITFDLKDNPSVHQHHIDSKWKFNFRKANVNNLNQYFKDINWEEIFGTSNINDCVDKFYDHMFRGFELHIPLSKQRQAIHPPWYDETLINLKNIKIKHYKLMKKFNVEQNRLNFIKSNKEFELYFNQSFKNYIANIQNKICTNAKNFWSFFNSKREINGYPATMEYKGTKTSNPLEIANSFANFFQSVYKAEDIESFTNPPGTNKNVSIHLPTITEDDILTALSSFGDGCGPDGIPSSILKTHAKELVIPLCMLFNKSLKSGIFPCKWKITKITPIFKSGHRSDVTCYRGVTSISSTPKLLELVVCNAFRNSVSRHISAQQHGFMPGRSTTTNLIEFTSDTIYAMENKNQVDTVYTDFSKAFDSISHKKALESICNFGFSIDFTIWFRSYLTDRLQYVEIGGKQSNIIKATSGVPQGAHVGPWIFIIHIDGVTEVISHSKVLIFADDLKLYRTIQSAEDTVKLQEDVNSLTAWCDQNLLQLNVNKCKTISYHRKKNPIVGNYHIKDNILERLDEIKDLGVTFVQNMTFNKHIELSIAKANSMLGFIKRWTQDIHDKHTLLILYFAYIRSQLEYAVTVWCPHYENGCKRIESVQKKFLLYVARKGDWDYDKDLPYYVNVARLPPYKTRCQELNLTSLERRRQFLGSSLVANTLLGNVDSPWLLEKIQLNAPGRKLRQNQMLHLNTHRTNYGENEPVNRIVKFFNSVEDLFDYGIKIDNFKKLLKSYYMDN